jgi:hypothetical protein
LSLAYGVALAALLLLEYARMSRHGPLPLGQAIHKFYAHFLDDRDMGHLVVTHLYLLLGCAFPLWLSHLVPAGKGGNPLLPYAGVFVLGIGDSMVSKCMCAWVDACVRDCLGVVVVWFCVLCPVISIASITRRRNQRMMKSRRPSPPLLS